MKMLAIRCPECKRLLILENYGFSVIYCPYCKGIIYWGETLFDLEAKEVDVEI